MHGAPIGLERHADRRHVRGEVDDVPHAGHHARQADRHAELFELRLGRPGDHVRDLADRVDDVGIDFGVFREQHGRGRLQRGLLREAHHHDSGGRPRKTDHAADLEGRLIAVPAVRFTASSRTSEHGIEGVDERINKRINVIGPHNPLPARSVGVARPKPIRRDEHRTLGETSSAVLRRAFSQTHRNYSEG